VYKLDQNYPNPFNPTTTIRYALPAQSVVSLKVYNILGQEVKTLVNENQISGSYAVQWDGKNNHGAQVSTGIYFYQLEVNGVGPSRENFTQVRKMLLLK
jgi:flagellar hook assembly protein FlgD